MNAASHAGEIVRRTGHDRFVKSPEYVESTIVLLRIVAPWNVYDFASAANEEVHVNDIVR